MATLVIDATDIAAAATATKRSGTAGGTFTAGMVGYYDSASRTWKPADNTTAAKAAASGIALNGASAGQPVHMLLEGELTVGELLTVGTTYVLAENAGVGGIAPVTDLGEDDFVTHVGIATTATVLAVKFNASGVAIPGA